MRNKLNLALAIASLAGASNAAAFFDDRLQVYVGESVTRDSNVFRISDGANANATIGSSERSDTFHATTVGVNLDTPISRQRVQAGIEWSQVRFNRFTSLDHLDRNAHLNWLWQAGDPWSGALGYTETQTLASFANFNGAQPNPLNTKVLTASANYLLDVHWQLQGLASEMRQRNALDTRVANDVDITTGQLGVNYISTAGNRIGVAVRQDDGHYPNAQAVGAQLISNDYTQRSVGALTDWTITAKSHLAARIDHVERDFEQFSGRNYRGTTYRAAYDWTATPKFTLTAVGQRDISASEDLQTSIVLVKGVSLTPSYAISEKLRLTATLAASDREYLGDPGAVLGGGSTFVGRVDKVHAASLSLSYQPLRALTVLFSAQHETRSSNVPLADYTANIINASARYAF